MQQFEDAIRRSLAARTGLAEEEIRIELPRDASMGDFAFPCFALAKVRRKAPPMIAGELAGELAEDLEGIAVEATGPYLNFKVDRATLARTIVGEIEARGAAYGNTTEGSGRTVVIDLSSPNLA